MKVVGAEDCGKRATFRLTIPTLSSSFAQPGEQSPRLFDFHELA